MININVKLKGVAEKILDQMVELGLASNKTEAIRLALIEYKTKLDRFEEMMVYEKMKDIDKKIEKGKIKKYSIKEVVDKYPEFEELI